MVNVLVLFRILTGGFLSIVFNRYTERAPKTSLAFLLNHIRAILSIPPDAKNESTWPGEAEGVDDVKGETKPLPTKEHKFGKQGTARRTEITVLRYK